MQLSEVESQLKALRGSLKMMPPLYQVTKALELKELHHRVNKERTRKQCITMHLDEFTLCKKNSHNKIDAFSAILYKLSIMLTLIRVMMHISHEI